MAESYSIGKDRPDCERCGAVIHSLEPATSIKFSGGVDTENLLVCHDCVTELIEGWWRDGGAVEPAVEGEPEGD